ncbi:MAG TPA: hypothetical protein VGB91_15210 [Rhizomicrobium sp.]
MAAMSDSDDKARRRRNIALALALGALVVLFYIMTMVRVHP